MSELIFTAKNLPDSSNPKGVFAIDEIDLSEIDVYGFDYDYTLARQERLHFSYKYMQ